MLVNNKKTKFFVLNCSPEERTKCTVGEMVVEWCDSCTYLGSILLAVSSAVASHASCKTAHVLKFASFLEKNGDVPFYVKRRVSDAAVMSAVLCGLSGGWRAT